MHGLLIQILELRRGCLVIICTYVDVACILFLLAMLLCEMWRVTRFIIVWAWDIEGLRIFVSSSSRLIIFLILGIHFQFLVFEMNVLI